MCTAVGSGGGRVTDFFWVALSNMIVVVAGLSGKPGPATVGRAGPLADRDLLARFLSYVDRIARAEKGLRGQVAPRKDTKKEGSLADSPSCREGRCSRKPRFIGPHTDTEAYRSVSKNNIRS
jgi:hypothetical protein